jgi:Na+/melibiose symporter-like transporter
MSFCPCHFDKSQLESNIVSLFAGILQFLLYSSMMYYIKNPGVKSKFHSIYIIVMVLSFILFILSIITIVFDSKMLNRGTTENIALRNSFCKKEPLDEPTPEDCENLDTEQKRLDYFNLITNAISVIISLVFTLFIMKTNPRISTLSFFMIIVGIYSMYLKSNLILK